MKTSTRVVAWVNIVLYILQSLLVLLLVAVLAFGGGAIVSGLVKSSGHHLSWADRSVGFPLIGAAAFIFLLFCLFLYPWISLLRQKAWAWWLLTILSLLNTVASLYPLVDSDLKLKHALIATLIIGILPMITLVTLLADRPSGWRGSRSRGKSPKRRRRSKK